METKRLVLGATVVCSLVAAACSSSSSPATPDSGSTNETSQEASTTTVSDASGSTGSDAGAGEAAASTLYTRLGGHAGIRSAIDAVVGKELADPDIVTYFFNQVATPIPAGHPTPDQIEECFTDLLGSLAGGTETYPPSGGVTDDAGTFMCRDMATIHQPLLISGGTFDKFITIAAGELTALGVSSADIGTIGSALEGTKSAIVTASLADAGLQPYPGIADAGGQ